MSPLSRITVLLLSAATMIIGSLAAVTPAQASNLPCTPLSSTFVLEFTASATSLEVTLPLNDFVGSVDWGDGSNPETYPSGSILQPEHSFISDSGDVFTVCVEGAADSFGQWGFSDAGGQWIHSWIGTDALTGVQQWGDLGAGFVGLDYAFLGSSQLVSVPSDFPATVQTTVGMFRDATTFNDSALSNWITGNVTDMTGMFESAASFNRDIGSWNTTNVTDMRNMFLGAAAFGDGATWNIGSWQTGRVLDMDNMFEDAAHFNQDLHRWDTGLAEGMNCMFCGATLFGADAVWSIGNWNTNSVEDMNAMFENATSFNQDIGNWNTSKVGTGSTFRGPGDMADMFAGATSFNQNIDTKAVTSGLLPYTAWDTSEVTDMQSMFAGATSFGDGASWSIGHWDTGNVTDMSAMFESAAKFNQDISSWDTSSVEDMYYMFAGATTFDQDINFDSVTGAWDTSSVTWMESMFENARSFSGDISGWDTSNVADMSYMFEGAALFNSNISGWKTGNVTTMESMMTGAESFEQQLSYNSITGAWDTSQVISMAGMFGGASLFDGDISGWQTGNVRSTFAMFQDAEAFDQDLGGWEIGSLVEAEYMFSNSGLSPLSYSKLLRGWAAGSHQTGTPLQPILLDVTTTAGPGTTYYSTVEAARQSLVAENWLIVDGGSVAPRVPLVWSNPTATNLTLGQSLGSSTLTGGTASQVGSFSFADPSLQPGLGRSNENVTFTPDNDIEFTTVTFSLDVVVEPASAPPTPATQPAALSHTGITIDAQGLLGWVLLAAGLLALAGRRAYARARAR